MSTWPISWVHVVWGGSHGLEGGLTPSPPKVRSVNWPISWVLVVWDGSHGLEGGLTTSVSSVRPMSCSISGVNVVWVALMVSRGHAAKSKIWRA